MFGGARAALAFVALVGCTPDLRVTVDDHNAAPFANAGTGGAVLVGSTVTLDARGSFDPDGTIWSFYWGLPERPEGSTTQIESPGDPSTSVVLDVVGQYRFELVVSDEQSAVASGHVVFIAEPPHLDVNAGADLAAPWRSEAQLSGAISGEGDFAIAPSWELVAQPPGSTAVLEDADTLSPRLYLDREGDYIARLTATTAHGSATDDVTISATVDRQPLAYSLVDAEYSKALQRYVIVSQGPATLHLHDPDTGMEDTIALAYVPKAVSISPDGLHAAVGHSGQVTIVDLEPLAVRTVYTLPVDVRDIVWGIDDRVHCFAYGGFAPEHIYTIDLTDDSITDNMVYADGLVTARLHPTGRSIYTADGSGTPTHIYRYDVLTAPISNYVRTPYHGEYEYGFNLWFTEDGNIIAASGNVFYSSTDPAVDMTYRTQLAGAVAGNSSVYWATHSPVTHRVATLGADYDSNFIKTDYNVRVYDDQQFAPEQTIILPTTPSGASTYLSEGRFAAFDATGMVLYTITRSSVDDDVVYNLYAVPL